MSDQYGLRAHNRRIANPRTVYHTPFYYKAQKVVQGLLQLLSIAVIGSLMAGVVLAGWFGVLAFAELVASWAK